MDLQGFAIQKEAIRASGHGRGSAGALANRNILLAGTFELVSSVPERTPGEEPRPTPTVPDYVAPEAPRLGVA